MNTPDHADAAIQGLQESAHPVGLRLRLRQHVARQDWWFGPDYTGSVLTSRRRRRAPHPEAVLQLRRRPGHDGARDPRPGLLQARRRPPRLGAGQGARASTSRSTSRWTASATRRCRSSSLRDMDLLYPNTTYVHASHFTDEEWALVRDSGGNVSFAPQIEVQMGHGWAPAVTALAVRPADRAVVGRRDDGAVRPVHPDALDLRLGARPQAPGGVGRGPRRARGRRRA